MKEFLYLIVIGVQSHLDSPAIHMSVSVDKLYEAYARLDRQLKERDYEAAVKTSKASTCQNSPFSRFIAYDRTL